MLPPTLKELEVSDLELLSYNLSESLESLYGMRRASEENLVGSPNELFHAESLLNKEIRETIRELGKISVWALSLLREVRKG